MTYEEAVAYLEQSASFGIKPGLERIEGLLDILGRPEKAYKTIHVTGTNGKGSVTAFIDSVLVNSGRRVGRYTSPHLIAYTERMCINGRDITPDAFGAVIEKVAAAVTEYVNGGGEPPTQFEVLTAAAFLFFKEQGVDYAVIEVGLGGLLDSTNVIVPEVAVITNVTVDHKKYCGDTPAEIAKHKAGIIKPGVPVITAAQGEPLGVIMAEAELKKAPLLIFNKAFAVESRRPMKGCQMITLGTAPKQPILAELGILSLICSVLFHSRSFIVHILATLSNCKRSLMVRRNANVKRLHITRKQSVLIEHNGVFLIIGINLSHLIISFALIKCRNGIFRICARSKDIVYKCSALRVVLHRSD